MKPTKIIALLSLLGCIACGGGNGGGGNSGMGIPSTNYELSEASTGTYYAVLRPVNFYSNGFIPYGSASFTVLEDQLQVSASLDDDQPVTHRQSLHLGTRCPTLDDDTNGDGFVDYNEAMDVVGPILMPLDDNLNSQLAGVEVYPRGRSMTYNRVASLSQINSDLWKADENPSDEYVKLPNGKRIGFENRVVLVHGTSAQRNFPTSLGTFGSEPAHLSLPVVCGVLKKIN